MFHPSRGQQGTTVYEVVIILSALATLSAVTAPLGGSMMEHAREVAARQQVETLGTAFQLLMMDHGGRFPLAGAQLLVSDGPAPSAADEAWTSALDGRTTLRIEEVLYVNGRTLPERGPGVDFGWKGPYLQNSLQADPWGHRYALALTYRSGALAQILVLSAGPDGHIAAPHDAPPPTRSSTNSDDLAFLVSH